MSVVIKSSDNVKVLDGNVTFRVNKDNTLTILGEGEQMLIPLSGNGYKTAVLEYINNCIEQCCVIDVQAIEDAWRNERAFSAEDMDDLAGENMQGKDLPPVFSPEILELAAKASPIITHTGRRAKADIVRGTGSQGGLPITLTRCTLIVPVELLKRFHNYAYTERLSIKAAATKLLKMALDAEEERYQREGIIMLNSESPND